MHNESHFENMIKELSNQQKAGQFCDVKLVGQNGEIFNCHKIVLATQSILFRFAKSIIFNFSVFPWANSEIDYRSCLFSQEKYFDEDSKIFLQDFPAEEIQLLLDMIYMREIKVHNLTNEKFNNIRKYFHLMNVDQEWMFSPNSPS